MPTPEIPAKPVEELNPTILETMGSEMVTLKVGKSPGKIFMVHKKLLCKKIPYFEKMFSRSWRESLENFATFPEDSAESFDVLVGWVYYGALRPMILSDEGLFSWNPIRFYALAEKLCLPTLQDGTMDLLAKEQAVAKRTLSPKLIRNIYKTTPKDCALRRYAAQTVVWRILKETPVPDGIWDTKPIQKLLNEVEELGYDVLTLMRGCHGKFLGDPREAYRCDFHYHDKEKPCFEEGVKTIVIPIAK